MLIAVPPPPLANTIFLISPEEAEANAVAVATAAGFNSVAVAAAGTGMSHRYIGHQICRLLLDLLNATPRA